MAVTHPRQTALPADDPRRGSRGRRDGGRWLARWGALRAGALVVLAGLIAGTTALIEMPTAVADAAASCVRITSARFNAAGSDSANLNGEWVIVDNACNQTVRMSGWRLTDRLTRNSYRFPAAFVLRPGASVRIHTGRGRNGAHRLYMAKSRPVWDNSTWERAYLRRPSGAAVSIFGRPSAPVSPSVLPGPVPQSGQIDCSIALATRLASTPAGGTLNLTGCTFHAAVTITRPITLVGATVHAPPGKPAITVRAADVTLDRLTIIGPSSSTYDATSAGVLVDARSSDPVRGLRVSRSEFRDLSYGLYLRNVTDFVASANLVEDVVYAGIQVLSAVGGTIEHNVIRRVGVTGSEANSGNAYGITVSAISSDRQSVDVSVNANLIEDVPTWHGLDTHGGIRVVFDGNTIRGTPRPIFITALASPERSATDVVIRRNQIPPPSGLTNLVPITLYATDGATITDNVITGWSTTDPYHDYQGKSTRITASGNIVTP